MQKSILVAVALAFVRCRDFAVLVAGLFVCVRLRDTMRAPRVSTS
jgi:hypothetical protein